MGTYLWRVVLRTGRVLWGPISRFFTGSATVLTLIGFLEQRLLGPISDTWQVVPWWVGLVALIPLLFYAFVRASYEEYRAAIEPPPRSAAPPDPAAGREAERLRAKLQRSDQEIKRLRASLADPNAEKRRDEARLLQRSGELAVEARNFYRAHLSRWGDEAEAVQRFRLRHYAEVGKVRAEMDTRKWLTEQERDDLILNANDGLDKIERMANVLGNIAVRR